MADKFEFDLLRLRVRSQRRLGISQEEFWRLTPAQLRALEADWRQDFALDHLPSAILARDFRNANRPTGKSGKPKGKACELADVLPFAETLERKKPQQDQTHQWASMMVAQFGAEEEQTDA